MCVQSVFLFSFSRCCFERCGTWLFELAFSIVHTLGEALRVSVLTVSSNFIADLKLFCSIGVADSFYIYIYICILSYWKSYVCIVITFSPFQLEVIRAPYDFHILLVWVMRKTYWIMRLISNFFSGGLSHSFAVVCRLLPLAAKIVCSESL